MSIVTESLIKPELQEYKHLPSGNVKNNKEYVAKTYVSIQSRVNSDPDFEIFYFDKLINEGWVKLGRIEDIMNPSLRGKYFKYRLNGHSLSGAKRGTFRSGGINCGPKLEEENPDYFLYRAFNGCAFSLQLSDILEIYIKNPDKSIMISNYDYSKRADYMDNKLVLFKVPKNETPFPVFLENPETGKNATVFYGKDIYAAERFQKTMKFLYAFETGNWGFT